MIGPIFPTSEQLVKLTSLMKEFTPSVSIRFGLQNTSLITYASESFQREVTTLFRPITRTTSVDQLNISRTQTIEFRPNERGLINNSPLGHQLIQFHCSGYPFREKIRGNFSWMKSMLKVRSSEFSEETPLVSKVSFKSSDYRWSMFSTYPQGMVKEPCGLDKYTIPCVSAHFPEDTSLLLPHRNVLYGCATTVFQTETHNTACNVTLFPPGHRWIKLALLCQGIDFNESDYQFKRRNENETEVLGEVDTKIEVEGEVEDNDEEVGNEDERVMINEVSDIEEGPIVASEVHLDQQIPIESDPLFSDLNADDQRTCQSIFLEFQKNQQQQKFSLKRNGRLIETIDSLFLPWIHQMESLPSLDLAIHPTNIFPPPPPPPPRGHSNHPSFQNDWRVEEEEEEFEMIPQRSRYQQQRDDWDHAEHTIHSRNWNVDFSNSTQQRRRK